MCRRMFSQKLLCFYLQIEVAVNRKNTTKWIFEKLLNKVGLFLRFYEITNIRKILAIVLGVLSNLMVIGSE